jgi:tetratricopeptide (TPR) repeat protein
MLRRRGCVLVRLFGALGVLGSSAAAAAAPAALTLTAEERELTAYMKELIQLRQRWIQAGDLASTRQFPKALALLSRPVPSNLGEVWRAANDGNVASLRSMPSWEPSRTADWLLAIGACAAADRTLVRETNRKELDDPVRRISLAQCYLAAGQTGNARRVLEGLARINTNPQFAPVIPERLAAIATLPIDSEPPPSFYVDQCRRGWFGNGGCSFWPVIRAWQRRDDDALLKLFGEQRAGSGSIDRKGQRLAFLAFARSPRTDPDRAAGALDALAHQAHDDRRVDESKALWREIFSQHPTAPVWGAATYNLALTIRREGHCDEAIPIFETLLASKVNDLDPGSHIMETYRNYRPLAQWNIGLCKLSSGDHAGALVAFRTLRTKYPFRSWCGNEHEEWAYRYDLYEGATLEHLGRLSEAVVAYCHATDHDAYGGHEAEDRLLALYGAAGQMTDLRQIVAPSSRREGFAYRLRIMDLEQKKAWPELVHEIRAVRRHEREPVVKALGRHGDETVPLLLAEVDNVDKHGRSNGGAWRALGRSATPRTIPAIVARAKREQSYDALSELGAGLHAAGPAGQAALAELGKDAPYRLRDALARLVPDETREDGDPDEKADRIVFPALPKKVRLPTSIARETAAP